MRLKTSSWFAPRFCHVIITQVSSCLFSFFFPCSLECSPPISFAVPSVGFSVSIVDGVVNHFSTVTAAMVKQLRGLTGAPMMDCKKALQHEGVDGNLEKAVEVLRKQGMKRVNKVSSRTTQQGVVASMVQGKKGVVVEVPLVLSLHFVA